MHRDPPARGRTVRRALALASIAAALAGAGPAAAQSRRDLAAKPPRAPAAAPHPAAAPAPAPLPAPAAEAAAPPRPAGWLAAAAGPWAGFGDGVGVAFQADYGFLRTPPGWRRAQLELRLSVMVAHPTEDTPLTTVLVPPYGTPVEISSGAERMTAWVIEAVPTARLRYPVHPKVALFADGGLGLAQTVESYDREEMFVGHSERSVNQTTVVVRLGGGLSVDLSERTRLVVLPLALSLQLGTGFSAYVPTFGLAYRL